ncbi:MAG: hypothetical protein FWB72_02100 [Firmicutes bacterium]|nr:hypothetical protein [Bacillota bacterium]
MKNSAGGGGLSVVTKTKDLIRLLHTYTKASPKKYRHTIVADLINAARQGLENIYFANATYVETKTIKDMERTLSALAKKQSESKQAVLQNEQAVLSNELAGQQSFFTNDKVDDNKQGGVGLTDFELQKQFQLKMAKRLKLEDNIQIRLGYSFRAMSHFNLLDFYITLAMEYNALTSNQGKEVVKLLTDCKNLLGAFINADRKKYAI